MDLTDDQKRAVFNVLTDTCGASPRLWDEFELHFPRCGEFRFQGDLGFGGKVYAEPRRLRVSCYREDQTPERAAAIERANTALADLLAA